MRLRELAHTRSGDKGTDVNIAVIARSTEAYKFLKDTLTKERVAQFFKELLSLSSRGQWRQDTTVASKPLREGRTLDSPSFEGRVLRYELDALGALNFVLVGVLARGVSALRVDAQGKALGVALLELEL